MELRAISPRSLPILAVLLSATLLTTGCGYKSGSLSGLFGTRSTESKAELASLSERQVLPPEEGEVARTVYEQRPSIAPAIHDQKAPQAPVYEAIVATPEDGGGHVRLTSHSQPSPTVTGAATELRLPGKVEHIGTSDFAQHVLESDVPVLVDFYADWCGPCRKLSPTLDRIAQQTPNAKVVKVNIDESPQIARKYGVRSIPTVMVFKNGTSVARHTGLADESSLLEMLAQ